VEELDSDLQKLLLTLHSRSIVYVVQRRNIASFVPGLM
jgi:hypothetical protein